MDILKPNPIHGWRDFVKEVGIIVLGVLIALSAEQVVQALDWGHKTRLAENSPCVQRSLPADDGPQVLERVSP